MISKNNLIRTLEKLIKLYESYSCSEVEKLNKDSFLNACSMSREILTSVESENYSEAKYKWNLLQRYSKDSLPVTGDFAVSFRILEQSITNFGLQ